MRFFLLAFARKTKEEKRKEADLLRTVFFTKRLKALMNLILLKSIN